MGKPKAEPGIIIVYDGECPFCSRYTSLLKLRAAVGPVRLVDARHEDPAVDRVRAAGFDLNDGMAVIDGLAIHHGADCIHRLSLMSTGSGFFNRFNALVFRSSRLSRIMYPVLRFGRNSTLKLLGRRPI